MNFFIGLLMAELRDQTKGSLSKRAGLARSGQGGCLLRYLLPRFALTKKAPLCASLKIRHLIIKLFFFLRLFSPSSQCE